MKQIEEFRKEMNDRVISLKASVKKWNKKGRFGMADHLESKLEEAENALLKFDRLFKWKGPEGLYNIERTTVLIKFTYRDEERIAPGYYSEASNSIELTGISGYMPIDISSVIGYMELG